MELASLLNVTTFLSVFEIIHKIETEFYVHPEGNNVTLVLGGSGVGKSTMVQRLIGLDSEMIAVYNRKTRRFRIDQENKTKIGHDLTVSKTIIPEILKNNQTGAIFGDMPGFDDTRGLSYQLCTTYFMKKIFDKISHVKLIFLISWSALDGTGNRDGFYNFLRMVSKYVKNIGKFKNSVALVVTKIPAGIEKTIVEDIAEILNEISTANMTSGIDKTFLNILLEDINGTYPKINVAKTPNADGSKLSNISYMVDNLANLTSMINKLEFTKVQFSDFGYTLPDKSLQDVINLGKKIENDIYGFLESYMLNFTNFLTKQRSQIHDIFKLKNESISLYDKLMEIKEEVGGEQEARKCVSKLLKSLDLIHYRPEILSTNATLYLNDLDFLRSLHPIESIFDCSKNLDFIIKKASESRNWFFFLDQLYTTLSSYEIQKNISSSTSGCFALFKFNYDLEINDTDLLEKLKKCHPHSNDYKDLSNIEFDSSKIAALRKLLNFTMNSNLHISCDANLLRVRGRYVRFTDVRDAIQNNCSSALPKKVEIFALDTIYVNDNLNLTSHLSTTEETVQLSIIAPNWYIYGSPQVTLDGKSASAIVPHKNYISEAPGKPGLPGGPGGHFLGIGTKFTNVNYLVVSLRGGDGGEGQVGGNGNNGTKGADAYQDIEWSKWTPPNNPERNYLYSGNFDIGPGGRLLHYISSKQRIKPITICRTLLGVPLVVIIEGQEGTKGRNGGSGGVGGIGGNAGNYFLAGLNETFVINLNGSNSGLDADGGEGGKGGEKGNSLSYSYPCNMIFNTESYEIYKLDGAAENGEKGMRGGNAENRINPKPSKSIQDLNLFEIINDYKKYLRENLQDCVIESKLIAFFSHLESDKEISKLYDTVGLIDDFEKLERQYFALYGSMSFLPFYESLLSRIGNDTSDENLNYLLTTLFTKIYNIKYNTNDYVVVNIKNYIDSVQNDIDNYENIIQNIKIIRNLENYEKTICEQIIEGNKIINDQILPEIENIYIEIDAQILALVDDLHKQGNELVKRESEIFDTQSKLLSLIPVKTSICLLKSVASILALAGPYGEAASIPIKVGTSIAESIVDDKYSKITSVEKGSVLLTDTSRYEEALNINKNNSFKLNVTHELYGKNETAKEIKEIVEQIEEFSQGRSSITNFINTITKSQKESNKNEKKDKNIKEKDMSGKIGTGVKEIIGETVTQISDQKKQFSIDLSDIKKEINKTYIKISQLKTIEKYYQETLTSDVNNINTKMFHNLTNLADKSLINLDLIKWKMENALKDFKVKMEYMIQTPSDDVNIKTKILNCIDKLQGGMLTIVKIYQRIQNYKDQQKLAGLILNIQNVRGTDAKMMKLKSTLQANLIILEYEKVFGSFKLFLFPSIYNYRNLSSNFIWSENVRDVMKMANKSIESMKRTLDLHFNTLDHQTKFSNTEYIGNDSYFVWDYTTYKTEISKLLRGEEVTLEADISQSHIADAMKFKEIGITFSFVNKTLENEFNNASRKINVFMTHMGNSGYKCGDKYYVLNHNIFNFTHSLNTKVGQNSFEGYVNYDDNYNKIKGNVPVFSPYATWKLILYDSSTSRYTTKNSFFQSGKFHNQTVDLLLEGIGGYVASASCNDIEKYYTLM